MMIKQVYRGGSEIGANSCETRKLETGMVRQAGWGVDRGISSDNDSMKALQWGLK
jgi:hypothetical protein